MVEGYGEGTYHPNQLVSHQELARMLYNYAEYKGCDLTAEGDLSKFPDGNTVAERIGLKPTMV